jgi:hypothetical protein
VHVTTTGIAEVVTAVVLSTSFLVLVLAVAMRFGVRPLLLDWAKYRGLTGNESLERRMRELEEEVRLLRMGANLQLPSETLQSGRSRT